MLFGRAVDARLNEPGEQQAGRLAERLRTLSDPLIYCSPRARTRRTAEIIAARHECDFTVAPELDEVDYGAWSGHRFADLDRDPGWRAWNHTRAASRTPAGITFLQVQHTFAEFAATLHERHSGRVLVLVTHAEVIRAAVMHYLQVPIDLYARIEISPASLTWLLMHERGPCIASVNERIAS